MKNKLKKLGALIVVVGLVGCASVSSVTNKMVSNTKEGVIYGVAGVGGDANAKSVCEAIANKDKRCMDANDYVVVVVTSKFGFADGNVGINALAPKNFKGLEKLNFNVRFGSKNAPFVKAKVIAGQLGEIIEIVSTDGDGKCYWSGFNGAGGTVCPAYNYDYRKDFTGVVFR